MELQIGKQYKNRNGETHGPLFISKRYPDRFTDEMGNWYGDDGTFWQQRPGCQFDLIELV